MAIPESSRDLLWGAVSASLPQFDWPSATFTRGAFHEVALIGNSTALRVCTGAGHEDRAVREMRTLDALASAHLTAAIPRLTTELSSMPEWSAYGTTVVEGSADPNIRWSRVRTSLAHVLTELATIPTDVVGPVRAWCGGPEWPERVSRILSDREKQTRRAAAAVIARLLDVESDAPHTFVHGDFGLHNILFENGRVSGLIDFDCAGIGDPAADLAPLIGCFGSAPLQDIADGATVMRARVHRATLSLQVAAAADIVGDLVLRNHAIHNFRDRLAAGTLEEPDLSLPRAASAPRHPTSG